MKRMRRKDRLNVLRVILFDVRSSAHPTPKDIRLVLVARIVRQLAESRPELGYEFKTEIPFSWQLVDDLEAMANQGEIQIWSTSTVPQGNVYVRLRVTRPQKVWNKLSPKTLSEINAVVTHELAETPSDYLHSVSRSAQITFPHH